MKIHLIALIVTLQFSGFGQETPSFSREVENAAEEEIVRITEIEPSYPGGPQEMNRFISENIAYPKEAMEKKEAGRVYVSFVVEKDGSLTDVKVERGVSPSIDTEAIRLVNAMPKWIPGQSNGKLVRVLYHLPFHFKLD